MSELALLCRQINFLYNVDAEWTVEHILQLLESTSKRTEQAWHGLLASSGISATLFASVRPYFEKMRGMFEELLPGKEAKFIEHYVAVAFWCVENPHIDWLPKLLSDGMSGEHKVIFACHLSRFFSKQKSIRQSDIWISWFKPYWQNRIKGKPMLFDAKEAGAMLSLLKNIPDLFEKMVSLIKLMPVSDLTHSNLLYSLSKKDWVSKYSNSVAILIIYLLESKETHSELYGLDMLVEKINSDDLDADVTRFLEQKLIASGKQQLCLFNRVKLATESETS
ncbi:DUF4020 domain-containing protein [uncultured Shewanella sp.]|uniref:DUF4020 domain-containing protein n=1 Tax=uncultured Shewanella sp. TaxID=173975 RepID=UPI0026174D5E|nr:DUF4020 domain-containing protein [uncultured Shewanella sp.]